MTAVAPIQGSALTGLRVVCRVMSFSLLLGSVAASAQVLINEVMAINQVALANGEPYPD